MTKASLRWPVAIAFAAGIAAALWAIGTVGLTDLVHAAARLGGWGFFAICMASVGILGLLGGAWAAAMPMVPARRVGLFAWARAAREAANDLLPFSQLGGLMVGGRTLTGAGLAVVPVYAAMIIDLTTEMASQLVVTLFGLGALATLLAQGGVVSGAAWGGAGIAVATLLAMVLFQRPLLSLIDRIGTRLLPEADLPLGRIRDELDRLYRAKAPILSSFLLNLAAWMASALLAWAILWLIGARYPVGRVVALESLIFAVRSAAFLIPGALGVQEAAYLLLAHSFGINAEAALALSVIKRARDVAIGLPTLLLWWAQDVRRGVARA
ncbi:lysylphosphatidylglycerol synthase domain-containing protein [Sphingomonas morindae]|uniref:Lysylphosphatidylglycerol synthase domain-containing protein n=1 Tax=Sphingomonas morindae TaxID=1541170 RepID=A0ABY4X454_9SPHN|nr:lysylphosphatidylglycerol synthase domain-containing protein [Sphingomonas morindae]USI71659.1 lysylphosphatidylglycerol synthase domain-containing protein [Sphingomonas morindae]